MSPGHQQPQRTQIVEAPAKGPLALVVLDSEDDRRHYTNALHRMGLRTTVRYGMDEALHALHALEPAVLLLRSWNLGFDGLTLIEVGTQFFPDLPGRIIALYPPDADEQLPHALYAMGVRVILREPTDEEALRRGYERLRRNRDQARGPSAPAEPAPFTSGTHETIELVIEDETGEHGEAQTDEPMAATTRIQAPKRTEDETAELRFEDIGHADPIIVGMCINERFVVESRLGQGATSVVYRVRDLLLNERVALKLLTAASTMDQARERFRREMRICRRLIHANIVRTFDFGIHEGAPYYTMELLNGAPLDELVDRRAEPLPVSRACSMMADALAGLAEAHRQGVVHRDVKTENLFVLHDGDQVKLMDFGVARLIDPQTLISREGLILGTPSYLAPEVLAGTSSASIEADIYAMGVVAFEVLTGHLPFESDDLATLLSLISRGGPPNPLLWRPELPPDLKDTVLLMLSREPRKRPGVAAELAGRFARWADALDLDATL